MGKQSMTSENAARRWQVRISALVQRGRAHHNYRFILLSLSLHLLLLGGYLLLLEPQIARVLEILELKRGQEEAESQQKAQPESVAVAVVPHAPAVLRQPQVRSRWFSAPKPPVAIEAVPEPQQQAENVPVPLPLPAEIIPAMKPEIAPVMEPQPVQNLPQKPTLKPAQMPVKGEQFGNAALAEQEVAYTYEDTLKAWIGNHQVKPVVGWRDYTLWTAVMQVELAQDGTILHYEFIQRTGNKAVDEALEATMENSNPVPPVPQGEPLKYHLPMAVRVAQ